MSKEQLSRRDFIKRAVALGVAGYGLGKLGRLAGGEEEAEAAGQPLLVVASKSHDPAALTRAAVNGLGGMRAFVKQGARVVIKPNMGWAREPKYAATTNPQVVAEVVKMCREAGARDIKVIDHPVDDANMTLRLCGIGPVAQAAGARVLTAGSQEMYSSVRLPRAKVLKTADVLKDIQRADVIINVPIAKVHNSTGLTLSCKNLMGAVWNRGAWHNSASLDQCVADFLLQYKPKLNLLDAWRILLTNGPKGPGQTKDKFMVAASVDPVALDAWGCTLFGKKPESIGHIRAAHESGLGEIDLKRVRVKYV